MPLGFRAGCICVRVSCWALQACVLDPSFQALVGLVDDVWEEMEAEAEADLGSAMAGPLVLAPAGATVAAAGHAVDLLC
jgi:hypothetical protein